MTFGDLPARLAADRVRAGGRSRCSSARCSPIVQTDVKRMLAYSSISHAGFILVGVRPRPPRASPAALFYLAAYTFMVAGTFGVVTVVGRRGDGHHALDDYRGLSRREPLLALAFTVFLLAQAGVPLTSGFFAKFYVHRRRRRGPLVLAGPRRHALRGHRRLPLPAHRRYRCTPGPDEDEEAPSPRPSRGRAGPASACRSPPAVALVVAVVVTIGVGIVPDPAHRRGAGRHPRARGNPPD